MVQMKFVGMLLGILFIMNALRDYYAFANHDHMEVGSNDELVVDAAQIHDHKEVGGRKMVVMKKKATYYKEEEERKRIMEETRKIVALMHRDYKGMNKPRRKPPINNHLPIH
ncbi:hypothetical protein LINPERPRIM_LOCUS6037 [Linum perenne]